MTFRIIQFSLKNLSAIKSYGFLQKDFIFLLMQMFVNRAHRHKVLYTRVQYLACACTCMVFVCVRVRAWCVRVWTWCVYVGCAARACKGVVSESVGVSRACNGCITCVWGRGVCVCGACVGVVRVRVARVYRGWCVRVGA